MKSIVVVQLPSCIQLFATPCTAAHQATLSLTISRSFPKFIRIALVTPSSHLILWCRLLLLPSIFSSIRGFSNESTVCIRWPKYWSFSFSISPFNEYSGSISFRIDWFDLLAVQGTLRSLLQHHSLKVLTPRGSIFLTVQLSNCVWPLRRLEPWLYRHQQSNVSVIAFLSRSKRLLISSLQSPSSVIL